MGKNRKVFISPIQWDFQNNVLIRLIKEAIKSNVYFLYYRKLIDVVNHPQYNVSSQAYDFALLQMDLPVHHLEIQIWEESLGDDHDHEKDHDHLVGSYGYVTGIVKQGADSIVKLPTN